MTTRHREIHVDSNLTESEVSIDTEQSSIGTGTSRSLAPTKLRGLAREQTNKSFSRI